MIPGNRLPSERERAESLPDHPDRSGDAARGGRARLDRRGPGAGGRRWRRRGRL